MSPIPIESRIVVEKLGKHFGRNRVLDGVTFTAEPGEITLLVGPNGAGKSTTLRTLAGLMRVESGRVCIAGHDISRDRIAAQRALSFLPQSPAFHPRFTCQQVLAFYARLRGAAPARIAHVLERVGLADARDQRTGTLSGGMRQRLGLAILLLPDAPVLLLDEPGLSLDPDWRRALQTILRGLAAERHTVLVTTHLIAEWNGVADRCLLCRNGRIERELDPADLQGDFDRPDFIHELRVCPP